MIAFISQIKRAPRRKQAHRAVTKVILILGMVLLLMAGSGCITFAEEAAPRGVADSGTDVRSKKQEAAPTPVTLQKASLPYTKTFATGKPIQPSPTVTAVVNGKKTVLKKGRDYSVSYKNNQKPGVATVLIKGTGNFRGTIKKTFRILQTEITGKGSKRSLTFAACGKKYGSLKVAVWSKRNGKNDLHWYKMQKHAKGLWTAKIKLSKLRYNGTYRVAVYAGTKRLFAKTLHCSRKDWLQAKAAEFQSKFLKGHDSSIDYVQTAISIAKNNYYGYGHSWARDQHTLSCAGLVNLSLTYCGYGDLIQNDPVQPDGTEWGYLDLGTYSGYNWPKLMKKEVGATWHKGTRGLKAGDILYYDYGYTSNHVAIYIGNGRIVEARGPEGGSKSDDYGTEISINRNLQSQPWQGYFRIPAKKINAVTKWKR